LPFPIPTVTPVPNNNASTQLNAAISVLLSFPKQPITSSDLINKPLAEEAVGDIAFQEKVSISDLAEYIYGPQFTQSDEQYADYLIYNAYQRAQSQPAPQPPQPAPQPAPQPTKPLAPSLALSAAIAVFRNIPDPAISQQDIADRQNAEAAIGDLALKENLTVDELVSFLFVIGKRGKYKKKDVAFANQLINDAIFRAGALKTPQKTSSTVEEGGGGGWVGGWRDFLR
jgi:hypothetical protein